ncbi:MAG: hypothetical protein ACRD2A_06950 [Vicinamibacterales bacterium]
MQPPQQGDDEAKNNGFEGVVEWSAVKRAREVPRPEQRGDGQ